MTEVMRPQTSVPTKEKKQVYNTNLNLYLKQNPQTFYPKQMSNVNPASTSYNFINFSPTKQAHQLVQGAITQKSAGTGSSNKINYTVSGDYHQARLYASNQHPIHVKALKDDKNAFRKQTGELAR